jgi:Gram-negative bacterial TonB protein C-terminal
MRVERIRAIAAATLFAVSSAALRLAGDSPVAAQYPASNPAPQANPSQGTPPARTPDQNGARNPYQPAKVVAAADVPFPFQTTADGVVVFSVSVSASGEARKIKVLNDVPPFTAAAEQSLRNWKFAPAGQNGRPEDTEMLVAFVFRHSVYIANEPPFTPIIPAKESRETRGGFVPPGILSINYAGYPANTIAMGAVVVQASVKPDGSTGELSVVRDLEGGFGPLAIKAAKHWKFQPALRNGRAVPSKVGIAFVFSSRALNPF